MMRSLLILAALLGLSAPALAQTRPLPQGEIRANGDITFGNTLKLGKREGNKTVITPDTLRILGPGSTGPADDFSVTLPDGVSRSLTTAITALRGDFSTLAEFKAARAPFGRNFATVGGCAAAGDGGAARYRRLTTAPTLPAKLWQVQIADGSWWEMMGDDVDVRQLCAMGGPWSTPIASLPNDYLKLQAAIDYVGLSGGRVRLPGGLRFRTDTGLVARVNWQTTPAVTGQGVHFKDNSTFELVSSGGGAIAAGASMNAVLTIRYNDTLANVGPFLTKVEGWTIDGNGLAANGIYSDFTMHINVTRNRVSGATGAGLLFTGYGVARIWGNVWSGYRCISLQGGGGDSWIGPNDFFPNANGAGVSVGKFGGNLTIENGVFNGEGKAGINGVDIYVDGDATDSVRHVKIRGNEFSGMRYAIRAAKSSTVRNIYGITISENHTTPAAGGAVHTGILAHLTGVDEAIIVNNMGNSSRQMEAADSMVLAFDVTNLQIIGNRAGNYLGPWLYFNNVRRSMVALNNVQDVGRAGASGVIVDLDNASEGNDFLDNTIRQTSTSFAQNGFFERTGSTGNYGRNRLIGIATPSVLSSGSTSNFTVR